MLSSSTSTWAGASVLVDISCHHASSFEDASLMIGIDSW